MQGIWGFNSNIIVCLWVVVEYLGILGSKPWQVAVEVDVASDNRLHVVADCNELTVVSSVTVGVCDVGSAVCGQEDTNLVVALIVVPSVLGSHVQEVLAVVVVLLNRAINEMAVRRRRETCGRVAVTAVVVMSSMGGPIKSLLGICCGD